MLQCRKRRCARCLYSILAPPFSVLIPALTPAQDPAAGASTPATNRAGISPRWLPRLRSWKNFNAVWRSGKRNGHNPVRAPAETEWTRRARAVLYSPQHKRGRASFSSPGCTGSRVSWIKSGTPRRNSLFFKKRPHGALGPVRFCVCYPAAISVTVSTPSATRKRTSSPANPKPYTRSGSS